MYFRELNGLFFILTLLSCIGKSKKMYTDDAADDVSYFEPISSVR